MIDYVHFFSDVYDNPICMDVLVKNVRVKGSGRGSNEEKSKIRHLHSLISRRTPKKRAVA